MRLLTAATVLAVASAPALAQPRADMRAEMCGVTFVRAPDEVRHEIERWLEAEPRCTSSIDLRVIPTDDGLYLLAQRPDGRIHERVVPDAQTAGVLVASWVADDWTAPPLATPPPAPPLTVIVDPTLVGPPGVRAVAPPPRERRAGKWLSLGVIVQPDNEGGGFRAEAEIFALGSWRLGAVLAYTKGGDPLAGAWSWGDMYTKDARVVASLSRAVRLGRWELRGSLGAGVMRTQMNAIGELAMPPAQTWGGSTTTLYGGESTWPVVELSGLVTRRLGDAWGIAIGPVVTVSEESFEASNATITRDTTQVTMFGGLRYEL